MAWLQSRLTAVFLLTLFLSTTGFSQTSIHLPPSWLAQLASWAKAAQVKNQTPVSFAEPAVMHLQVLDSRTGEMMTGFHAGDFEIYEDGVKRPIVWFGYDKRPRSIVLLLDTRGLKMDELVRLRVGLREVLTQLRPEDEVGLMMLGEHAIPLLELTRDRKLAEEKLDLMMARDRSIKLSPEQLGAVLLEGSEYLRAKAATGTQRMLIPITGDEEIFRLKSPQILDRLLQGDSVICGILGQKWRKRDTLLLILSSAAGVPYPAYELMNLKAIRNRLQSHLVAINSGGEVLPMDMWVAGPVLMELFERLEGRYSLGYIPAGGPDSLMTPDRFKTVQVRFNPKLRGQFGHLQIRTRRGYFASPSSVTAPPGQNSAEASKSEIKSAAGQLK